MKRKKIFARNGNPDAESTTTEIISSLEGFNSRSGKGRGENEQTKKQGN